MNHLNLIRIHYIVIHCQSNLYLNHLNQFQLESRIYNCVCAVVSIASHSIQLHNYMNAASIVVVVSLAQFHHTIGKWIRFEPTDQPTNSQTCYKCAVKLQQTWSITIDYGWLVSVHAGATQCLRAFHKCQLCFFLYPFAQYHLNTNRELCAVSNQMRQCCACVSVCILYRDQCYSYWNDIYALYLTFDKFCNLLPELPECWHKILKTINIWSTLWPCVKHSGADALTNHLEFDSSRNQYKQPVWTF